MKRKKTKKRKPQNPPLSALDKFIYVLAFLLVTLLALGFAFLFEKTERLIAEINPSTVAFFQHKSVLFIMPFSSYVFVSAIVFILCKRIDRAPIFGSKVKKRYVNPSQKKLRREYIGVWCAGLVLTLLLFPLGLFGRTSLLQDNSIVEYNVFNKLIRQYTQEDFSALTLKTDFAVGYRGGSHRDYAMEIITNDGRKHTFSNRDFITYDHEEQLNIMTEIKNLFPTEKITVKGKEDIDKTADFIGLTDSERQMLNRLFDQGE